MAPRTSLVVTIVAALTLLMVASLTQAHTSRDLPPLMHYPVPEARYFQRLVVLGDFHGDFEQALRILLKAKLISLQPEYYSQIDKAKTSLHGGDGHHRTTQGKNYVNQNMIYNKRAHLMLGSDADAYHWCGAHSMVVITGDAMNVGPDDLAIVRLVMRLHVEAEAAGGHVEFLYGNHEIRNLEGDFAGVHPWSFEMSGGHEGRKLLLSMSSDVGRFLRTRRAMFLWNGWLFMHGGLTGKTVEAIKKHLHPFNPTKFVNYINDAVTQTLVYDGTISISPSGGGNTVGKRTQVDDGINPPPSKPSAKTRALANIILNVDYKTNGDVNPLLIHPLKMCTEVHQGLKMLAGVVTAQFVGHTPHPLPDYVFCDGELMAIDFGNSRWKTGVGAAVSALELKPSSAASTSSSSSAEVSGESSSPTYSNKRTLGNWVAKLHIVYASDLPTMSELVQDENRTLFWYRIALGLLMLIAMVLSILLFWKVRDDGATSRDNWATTAGASPTVMVRAESSHLLPNAQEKKKPHSPSRRWTSESQNYGAVAPS